MTTTLNFATARTAEMEERPLTYTQSRRWYVHSYLEANAMQALTSK